MANKTTLNQQHEDENLEDLYIAPTEAEIAAMLRAIAPARRMLYRKRLMRKAGKGLITAACLILLAKAADNTTQQPTTFPASDAVAQTTPIVAPVSNEHPSISIDQRKATAVIPRTHAQRAIARHKVIPVHRNLIIPETNDPAMAVNQPHSADVFSGKPVDLPSNTVPVTGERTFAAAPGLPPVVLATPN